jgi:hypothetical protein
MMGCCVTLIVLAWFVVRIYSTPAAIVMSLIAMAIPPFAAVVGNRDIDHSDNTDQHRSSSGQRAEPQRPPSDPPRG